MPSFSTTKSTHRLSFSKKSQFFYKVVNIFCVAAILLTNITGVVQAHLPESILPAANPTESLAETENSKQIQDLPVCVQAPADLLSYWSADGDAKDNIGGHNGNLINGTAFATGKFGQAFSFDGVNDYIELGNWFTLQDFSISMWIQTGTSQKTYADIMDNNHRTGVNWVIQQSGSTLNRYSWSGMFEFVLTAGQWQHLVVTHNSQGIYTAYLDGTQIDSVSTGLINYNGTQMLRFGNWGADGRQWKGLMDEVKLYDHALNSAEVMALFTDPGTQFCSKIVDINKSTLEVSPSQNLLADGSQFANVVVTARNTDGNPATQTRVVLAATGANTAIHADNYLTDANGTITAQIRSTEPGIKGISAGIVTPGGTLYIPRTAIVVFNGAEISGTVFEDQNQNGSLDGNDLVIPGIHTNLLNNYGEVIASTTSHQDGEYRFEGLQAGNYQIVIEAPFSYSPTVQTQTITLGAFETAIEKNFALLSAAVVNGQTWNDVNQNQSLESGETFLTGVVVKGVANGVEEVHATSNQTGRYRLKLPVSRPAGPVNFNFDIPGASEGDGLKSRIYNADFETPTQVMDSSLLPVNGTFETGGYSLATSTFPENYQFESGSLAPWQSDTFLVISGSYDGSMTAYRPNGSAGSLTSPAFIIPAEAQALSWWWNNNQSASCDTDFILLDAQTGQNLTTLYANTCTGGTWKRFYADITAFAGRQVKLQIVNEDINERVYLDDVELTILVPGWIFSGNISGATTAQVAGGSYNGSNALYRPAGISGSLTSSAFEIPASAQTLSWWWSNNHQVNPDTDFYLLDAETGQVLVTMYTNLSTSGTWRHSYFNIAAYRGKIVQFRIVNEDGNEAFYLDDVQFNVQIPGWTLYGNTSASSSAQIKTGSYNGSKALFRPSGASGSMTSPVFVVPDEAQTLSWWWSNNHYVSPDTDFYLLDAETGQALATLYTNISTGGTWKQYFYNITPYRGKAVQFHVVNEDASEELYLDDLRLNVQIPGWEITGGVGGANVTQIASGSYDGSTALYRPAGAPASLTSPAFQIPPTAQTLNWWWNNNKSLMADTDFYLLDAQTGQTLATLASNVSTLGVWKQFSINISPYASRTVKLHVVNEDALEYLYLDNILITPYATQTYTISEINPIGYQSSTTDTIIQSFYGGQYFTVNFGDYTLDVAKSTLTVSPDSLTANGTETAQVVVSIKDALGNPMPGRDVRVESSGQNITIDQPELTTDAQGQVTATLHSTVAQTIEVKARDLAENIGSPQISGEKIVE